MAGEAENHVPCNNTELLLGLTKDVAVLSAEFKNFKDERTADNQDVKEAIKELKEDVKELKTDMTSIKAEPGKQAKSRQDKIIDYVILGVIGYIGVLLTTYIFKM